MRLKGSQRRRHQRHPTNPILFDHDGDGIKTATSWVTPQDGLLVLDRNGNGVIDSGRELFGDSTLLGNGQTAFDGFAALADLDTNKDGVFNASDTQFNNVRVWRDANSGAVSQAGELLSLPQLNILSLSLTKTAANQILPDGSRIADIGTFTYANGTTSTLATTGKLADADFRENTFYSNFTTPVAITPAAQALPTMSGSGLVRDLREAASLSLALTTALTNYAATPTRAAQLAQLDGLIDAWGNTSNLTNFVDRAIANNLLPMLSFGNLTVQSLQTAANNFTVASGAAPPSTSVFWQTYQSLQSPEFKYWINLLDTLEKFNGRYFFNFDQVSLRQQSATVSYSVKDPTQPANTGLQSPIKIIPLPIAQAQLDLLTQSYAALRQSVYDGLLLDTRLKPYMEAIGIVTDTAGNLSLDFTGMEAALNQSAQRDMKLGLTGDITPGSVYAHIDQSLGAWEQRPVLKTNVKQFVSLRKMSPPIPTSDLRRLTEFFPRPVSSFLSIRPTSRK